MPLRHTGKKSYHLKVFVTYHTSLPTYLPITELPPYLQVNGLEVWAAHDLEHLLPPAFPVSCSKAGTQLHQLAHSTHACTNQHWIGHLGLIHLLQLFYVNCFPQIHLRPQFPAVGTTSAYLQTETQQGPDWTAPARASATPGHKQPPTVCSSTYTHKRGDCSSERWRGQLGVFYSLVNVCASLPASICLRARASKCT